MNPFIRAVYLGRFIAALPELLRNPVRLDQARQRIRHLLDHREENFLRSAERYFFNPPSSPYLRLLQLAGCELGDLRESVRRNGIEDALRQLRNAGVYMSFEEFKGQIPIERAGHVIHVRSEDFDNPDIRASLTTATTGSTGRPSVAHLSFERVANSVPHRVLAHHAHSVLGVPTAVWRRPLDAAIHMLLDTAAGQPVERCFTTRPGPRADQAWRDRATFRAFRASAALAGVRLPPPEPVGHADPHLIARWAADRAGRGTCLLVTGVSLAVRMAAVASEAGLDLSGLAVFASGEPITPAKTRALHAVGGRWVAHYTLTEAPVGLACAGDPEGVDVHVLDSSVALTQHPRMVSGGREVSTFHLTSLLPSASKILLNVETDDYGTVERRACGCPLGEIGFARIISGIASFAKLNTEGVSLLEDELVRVLRDTLPRRFGGTPLDYQIVEEEDGTALGRLVLLVGPNVPAVDDRELIDVLLGALGTGRHAADVRSVWTQGRTVVVRRSRPELGPTGKFTPILKLSDR